MDRTPKGSLFFPGVLKKLYPRPTKVKAGSARKTSARMHTKKKQRANPDQANAYRSAEIECQDCACDAAKKLAGTRFLLSDVPLIPVPDCTSPNCKCSYTRYKDRRSWAGDRRALFTLHNEHRISDSSERREKESRRAGDDATGVASDDDSDFESWTK